jgi:hypothetical protein
MTKKASNLRVGDWIKNGNLSPFRVVSVDETRDGEIIVHHDFGNGGEPATSFYRKNEMVVLAHI